jgi:tetratricopeptide (TPR) repeat protein
MHSPRLSLDARRAASLVLIAIIAAGPAARAEPTSEPAGPQSSGTREQAKQLSDEGMSHYRAGAYDRALDAFTRSYELSLNPALLFNLGQAARLAGQCRKAVSYYETYLREAPGGPPYRAEAEERISDARQCVGNESPPAVPPLAVPPAAASAATTKTEPAAVLLGKPQSPVRERTWVRPTAIGGAVATAAFAAVGVGFAVVADSHADKLTAQYDGGGQWTPEAALEQSRGESAQRWSTVSFGVSAAFALATAGLWWWARRASHEP